MTRAAARTAALAALFAAVLPAAAYTRQYIDVSAIDAETPTLPERELSIARGETLYESNVLYAVDAAFIRDALLERRRDIMGVPFDDESNAAFTNAASDRLKWDDVQYVLSALRVPGADFLDYDRLCEIFRKGKHAPADGSTPDLTGAIVYGAVTNRLAALPAADVFGISRAPSLITPDDVATANIWLSAPRMRHIFGTLRNMRATSSVDVRTIARATSVQKNWLGYSENDLTQAYDTESVWLYLASSAEYTDDGGTARKSGTAVTRTDPAQVVCTNAPNALWCGAIVTYAVSHGTTGSDTRHAAVYAPCVAVKAGEWFALPLRYTSMTFFAELISHYGWPSSADALATTGEYSSAYISHVDFYPVYDPKTSVPEDWDPNPDGND